ncbi:uncharacterized protein LOC141857105 [Brevipalpus obovatus]|uniref:uncharacterized protein LOC141857105 n=1 Tax=Brevipalpus obovatus TaxID=246614 RepID=UPI003D9F0A19
MVRETRHLLIGNLSDNITEERIWDHFKRFGKVQNVKILSRKSDCVSAIVSFIDIISASKAYNSDNKLSDRNLRTDYYEPPALIKNRAISGSECIEDDRPSAVCVRNLPVRSTDTSIKDGLFHEYKKHGKVTMIKVTGQGTDRFAVVCFKKAEDVEKALEVYKNKLFFGTKIEVTPHEGIDVEDNDSRPLEAELDEYHPKATRTLFVGNLEKDITLSELRSHFEQFGDIIEIDIKKQGNNSTYAFIQYSDISSVVRAMRKLDGEKLGSNRIKLGFGKSMPTDCVWLHGIPESMSEKCLNRHCSRFGPVKELFIDHKRGKGLVFYDNVESAQIAVTDLKGRLLSGRKIQVDFASRDCQNLFFEKPKSSGQQISSNNSDKSWERRPSSNALGNSWAHCPLSHCPLTNSRESRKSLSTQPDILSDVFCATKRSSSTSNIDLQLLEKKQVDLIHLIEQLGSSSAITTAVATSSTAKQQSTNITNDSASESLLSTSTISGAILGTPSLDTLDNPSKVRKHCGSVKSRFSFHNSKEISAIPLKTVDATSSLINCNLIDPRRHSSSSSNEVCSSSNPSHHLNLHNHNHHHHNNSSPVHTPLSSSSSSECIMRDGSSVGILDDTAATVRELLSPIHHSSGKRLERSDACEISIDGNMLSRVSSSDIIATPVINDMNSVNILTSNQDVHSTSQRSEEHNSNEVSSSSDKVAGNSLSVDSSPHSFSAVPCSGVPSPLSLPLPEFAASLLLAARAASSSSLSSHIASNPSFSTGSVSNVTSAGHGFSVNSSNSSSSIPSHCQHAVATSLYSSSSSSSSPSSHHHTSQHHPYTHQHSSSPTPPSQTSSEEQLSQVPHSSPRGYSIMSPLSNLSPSIVQVPKRLRAKSTDSKMEVTTSEMLNNQSDIKSTNSTKLQLQSKDIHVDNDVADTRAHSPGVISPTKYIQDRIKALDERYIPWSRSTVNANPVTTPTTNAVHTDSKSRDAQIPSLDSFSSIPSGSTSTPTVDYSKYNIKKKSQVHPLSSANSQRSEPSDIVRSLLSKSSIFDQDSKRLEHINEKYEPKDIPTENISPQIKPTFRTKAAAKEFSSPIVEDKLNTSVSLAVASSSTILSCEEKSSSTSISSLSYHHGQQPIRKLSEPSKLGLGLSAVKKESTPFTPKQNDTSSSSIKMHDKSAVKLGGLDKVKLKQPQTQTQTQSHSHNQPQSQQLGHHEAMIGKKFAEQGKDKLKEKSKELKEDKVKSSSIVSVGSSSTNVIGGVKEKAKGEERSKSFDRERREEDRELDDKVEEKILNRQKSEQKKSVDGGNSSGSINSGNRTLNEKAKSSCFDLNKISKEEKKLRKKENKIAKGLDRIGKDKEKLKLKHLGLHHDMKMERKGEHNKDRLKSKMMRKEKDEKKEKEKEKEKDKDKEKDREKMRNNKDRSKEKFKSKEKDREKDREKDHELITDKFDEKTLARYRSEMKKLGITDEGPIYFSMYDKVKARSSHNQSLKEAKDLCVMKQKFNQLKQSRVEKEDRGSHNSDDESDSSDSDDDDGNTSSHSSRMKNRPSISGKKRKLVIDSSSSSSNDEDEDGEREKRPKPSLTSSSKKNKRKVPPKLSDSDGESNSDFAVFCSPEKNNVMKKSRDPIYSSSDEASAVLSSPKHKASSKQEELSSDDLKQKMMMKKKNKSNSSFNHSYEEKKKDLSSQSSEERNISSGIHRLASSGLNATKPVALKKEKSSAHHSSFDELVASSNLRVKEGVKKDDDHPTSSASIKHKQKSIHRLDDSSEEEVRKKKLVKKKKKKKDEKRKFSSFSSEEKNNITDGGDHNPVSTSSFSSSKISSLSREEKPVLTNKPSDNSHVVEKAHVKKELKSDFDDDFAPLSSPKHRAKVMYKREEISSDEDLKHKLPKKKKKKDKSSISLNHSSSEEKKREFSSQSSEDKTMDSASHRSSLGFPSTNFVNKNLATKKEKTVAERRFDMLAAITNQRFKDGVKKDGINSLTSSSSSPKQQQQRLKPVHRQDDSSGEEKMKKLAKKKKREEKERRKLSSFSSTDKSISDSGDHHSTSSASTAKLTTSKEERLHRSQRSSEDSISSMKLHVNHVKEELKSDDDIASLSSPKHHSKTPNKLKESPENEMHTTLKKERLKPSPVFNNSSEENSVDESIDHSSASNSSSIKAILSKEEKLIRERRFEEEAAIETQRLEEELKSDQTWKHFKTREGLFDEMIVPCVAIKAEIPNNDKDKPHLESEPSDIFGVHLMTHVSEEPKVSFSQDVLHDTFKVNDSKECEIDDQRKIEDDLAVSALLQEMNVATPDMAKEPEPEPEPEPGPYISRIGSHGPEIDDIDYDISNDEHPLQMVEDSPDESSIKIDISESSPIQERKAGDSLKSDDSHASTKILSPTFEALVPSNNNEESEKAKSISDHDRKSTEFVSHGPEIDDIDYDISNDEHPLQMVEDLPDESPIKIDISESSSIREEKAAESLKSDDSHDSHANNKISSPTFEAQVPSNNNKESGKAKSISDHDRGSTEFVSHGPEIDDIDYDISNDEHPLQMVEDSHDESSIKINISESSPIREEKAAESLKSDDSHANNKILSPTFEAQVPSNNNEESGKARSASDCDRNSAEFENASIKSNNSVTSCQRTKGEELVNTSLSIRSDSSSIEVSTSIDKHQSIGDGFIENASQQTITTRASDDHASTPTALMSNSNVISTCKTQQESATISSEIISQEKLEARKKRGRKKKASDNDANSKPFEVDIPSRQKDRGVHLSLSIPSSSTDKPGSDARKSLSPYDVFEFRDSDDEDLPALPLEPMHPVFSGVEMKVQQHADQPATRPASAEQQQQQQPDKKRNEEDAAIKNIAHDAAIGKEYITELNQRGKLSITIRLHPKDNDKEGKDIAPVDVVKTPPDNVLDTASADNSNAGSTSSSTSLKPTRKSARLMSQASKTTVDKVIEDVVKCVGSHSKSESGSTKVSKRCTRSSKRADETHEEEASLNANSANSEPENSESSSRLFRSKRTTKGNAQHAGSNQTTTSTTTITSTSTTTSITTTTTTTSATIVKESSPDHTSNNLNQRSVPMLKVEIPSESSEVSEKKPESEAPASETQAQTKVAPQIEEPAEQPSRTSPTVPVDPLPTSILTPVKQVSETLVVNSPALDLSLSRPPSDGIKSPPKSSPDSITHISSTVTTITPGVSSVLVFSSNTSTPSTSITTISQSAHTNVSMTVAPVTASPLSSPVPSLRTETSLTPAALPTPFKVACSIAPITINETSMTNTPVSSMFCKPGPMSVTPVPVPSMSTSIPPTRLDSFSPSPSSTPLKVTTTVAPIVVAEASSPSIFCKAGPVLTQSEPSLPSLPSRNFNSSGAIKLKTGKGYIDDASIPTQINRIGHIKSDPIPTNLPHTVPTSYTQSHGNRDSPTIKQHSHCARPTVIKPKDTPPVSGLVLSQQHLSSPPPMSYKPPPPPPLPLGIPSLSVPGMPALSSIPTLPALPIRPPSTPPVIVPPHLALHSADFQTYVAQQMMLGHYPPPLHPDLIRADVLRAQDAQAREEQVRVAQAREAQARAAAASNHRIHSFPTRGPVTPLPHGPPLAHAIYQPNDIHSQTSPYASQVISHSSQVPPLASQVSPHSSQVSPQGYNPLLDRYPAFWQGLLSLKNVQAAVQMHYVSGSQRIAHEIRNTVASPVRIAQRMRLEHTQLEGVVRKMQVAEEHCIFLALPTGREQAEFQHESNSLRTGFIEYLLSKQAAGIVNSSAPNSQQAYVIHIFPTCDFSSESLARIAPDLSHSVTEIPHLLIIVATV